MKLTNSILAAALLLSACGSPTISQPVLESTPFPPTLLEPARKMQPIPTEAPSANENRNSSNGL